MHLRVLDLTDFRSYEHVTLQLRPGVTVFVGSNGQGKTNLVEAVWYLAALSSHRVSHDAAMVRRGAETAIIRAGFVRAGRDVRVDAQLAPGRGTTIRLNGQGLSRPREVLGQVRAVLFSPEDLALIKGDPEGRRRFLDEILYEIAPRFASIRADFDRVLKQRNSLLKQMRQMRRAAARSSGSAASGSGRSASGRGRGQRPSAAPLPDGTDPAEAAQTTLQVWDEQLARTGAELIRARLHLVNRLRPHVGYSYMRVATDEGAEVGLQLHPADRGAVATPANIRYTSSVLEGELQAASGPVGPDSPEAAEDPEVARAEKKRAGADPPLPTLQQLHDALLEQLTARHDDEIDRGITLSGPHRDDMEIRLHDFPAKGYASHGESWSLALALRLGSYDLLTIEEGDLGDGEPILILDDVFSELDQHRRERLGRIIAGAEQVLITTANDSDIPRSVADGSAGELTLVDVTKGRAEIRGGTSGSGRPGGAGGGR
ncbi:DNA replication/repair protein RecF [Helcobacillus massiliensis]|uniref:DNA replication/repair protein RecF n=1 Tax=Helcobacillus massiliensis TaxID=521392 RepID=UPI0039EE7ECD